MAPWPYPRWIAHRGAGKLAPENTLAAFRLGAAHGYRAFECDVKLSADDVPFLLHDATLERTTDRTGTAGALPWSELSRLDAGSWHGRAYAGEPLPTLQTISRYVQRNGFALNIEIKPTPGHETRTGERVAKAAARLWHDGAPDGAVLPVSNTTTLPLLTSFRPDALAAARDAAPHLPRGLLLDALREGWLDEARELGCAAVVLRHGLVDAALVRRLRDAGLRTLCYTVNEPDDVDRLGAFGVAGLITDRVDLHVPADA